MKDKKFTVLCILGVIWLLILGAVFLGVKVNPRIEQLVCLLGVGWFAFWTISLARNKSKK